MKPLRAVSLVLGGLLAIPAIVLVVSGAVLTVAYLVGRDDSGYLEVTPSRFESATPAITAEQLDLDVDPGSPDWIIDALDVDVRLRVASSDPGRAVFVGIGPEADVDAYLLGVAHDEITELDDDLDPRYRSREGTLTVDSPDEQGFWVATTSGPGTQELSWEATPGRWAVVLMNADGSPGVAVDTDVGVRPGFLLPLAVTLLAAGVVATLIAVTLIVAAAVGSHADREAAGAAAAGDGVGTGRGPLALDDTAPSPVALRARLDPDLSRWQWLVKWILAIPHLVVLFFLWIAFAVVTVVAGVAILFTGRYPESLFSFNVGVLRWSWRVSYYASTGGIGTDVYPPFSLADDRSYPATLAVEPPATLSRWQVLVKWWLLAIPHYLIVGIIAGGALGWSDDGTNFSPSGGGGLLAVLVLIAGIILLVTGRYPRALFDLIVGLNRWVYRVVAYAALMTDTYPPFRLDQGGDEPLSVGDDG